MGTCSERNLLIVQQLAMNCQLLRERERLSVIFVPDVHVREGPRLFGSVRSCEGTPCVRAWRVTSTAMTRVRRMNVWRVHLSEDAVKTVRPRSSKKKKGLVCFRDCFQMCFFSQQVSFCDTFRDRYPCGLRAHKCARAYFVSYRCRSKIDVRCDVAVVFLEIVTSLTISANLAISWSLPTFVSTFVIVPR